jgi:hypothetical protein
MNDIVKEKYELAFTALTEDDQLSARAQLQRGWRSFEEDGQTSLHRLRQWSDTLADSCPKLVSMRYELSDMPRVLVANYLDTLTREIAQDLVMVYGAGITMRP